MLGPAAQIHAVDKDRTGLDELEHAYAGRFGAADGLHVLKADFRTRLNLPGLDGVLMANSLHFFQGQGTRSWNGCAACCSPAGGLLLVEYNVDKGNPWVPYPLSFPTFAGAGREAGFEPPRLVATHPSSFLREFYSAQTRADLAIRRQTNAILHLTRFGSLGNTAT